jgi:hypothetical protein
MDQDIFNIISLEVVFNMQNNKKEDIKNKQNKKVTLSSIIKMN